MKTMSSQIDRKAIIFAMVSSVLLCSMCSQPSFATDFTPPDNRDTWFIAFVATVYSVSEIREQPPQPVKWDVLTAIFEPEKLNISLAAPETPFSAKRFRALQALALSKGSGAAPYKVKKIIKQRLKDTTLTQTVHCLALMCCICGLVNITLSQETIESWLYASFFCFNSRMRQCAFV